MEKLNLMYCQFNCQIGKFMSSNLDFFSAKSGIRTRGLTSAANSEVCFTLIYLPLSALKLPQTIEYVCDSHVGGVKQ